MTTQVQPVPDDSGESGARVNDDAGALIEVSGLHFRYGNAGRRSGRSKEEESWTLADVDMTLAAGATIGIVGESGSGKSTLVRLLCGLLTPNTGELAFAGRPVSDWLADDRLEFHRRNQIVFQSPASSLDPRLRVQTSLSEPMRALERRKPTAAELDTWLGEVGLSDEVLRRYPHQLSGGQLQRIAIARALSVRPDVLYADEPTSALDVSVQAQVLNLLMDLRRRHGLTLVMVSHDLAVVARLCENVVVVKDGRVVEAGRTASVLRAPTTAYTQMLVTAAEATSLAAH